MAKASNRQKYNFLVALTGQLEEATDNGDEEGAAFVRVLEGLVAGITGADEQGFQSMLDRIAKLEQWNAQLNDDLEGLESRISEDIGEDDDLDDDSDDDPDLARHGPEMGRGRVRTAGPTAAVAGTVDVVDGQATNICRRRPVR